MDVLQAIPYLHSGAGGPVVAVREYASGLMELGCRMTIASSTSSGDEGPVEVSEGVELLMGQVLADNALRFSPQLARKLKTYRGQIVHSHGLWTHVSYLAGKLARRRGLPHVLAPCGMLQPGALRRSWWKKRIVRFLFQDRVLERAACLHAKSEAEYRGIREFGLENPVAVVPNPVRSPESRNAAEQARFRRAYGIPEQRRLLLFLGRLHPVKGLGRLIRAWNGLRDLRQGWHLIIAGPDEVGHRSELEERAATLGREDSITFTGPLAGTDKSDALCASDLFVMPSDFENFGTAIAEAMLAGLPVVTTTGTPWHELEEQKAGWWVSPNPDALTTALTDAMELSDPERSARGQRARKLAEAFRPVPVARELLSVYRWLLGESDRPECVRM
jgi:glycosyltransferase involved in cell wall biosynthesis